MTSNEKNTLRRFTPAVVLAVALWAIYASQRPSPTSESTTGFETARAPSAEETEAAQQAILETGLRVGSELTYRFHRGIEMATPLMDSGRPIEVQAQLVLRVLRDLARESGRSKRSKWLCEIELRTDDGKSSLAVARAELSKDLEIVRLEGQLENEAGWALKDALSSWAFFGQEDTSGSYRAQITEQEGVWTKSKLAYTQFSAPAPAKAPQVKSSSHRMKWDPQISAPFWIEGSEKWELQPTTSGTIALSYRLDLLSSAYFKRPLTQGSLPQARLSNESALASHDSRELKRTTTGRTWSELRSALLRSDALSGTERLTLFNDLLTALKANPGLASELEAIARKAGPAGSRAFSLAIGTLATAASPEAQASLRSLYRDAAIPTEAKGQILSAWTTTDGTLDPPTRALLRSESEGGENSSLSSGASYALGSAMRHGVDPESLDSIRKIHSSAMTAADRERALEAMGNSGRPEFVETMKQELQSENEQLRSAAAFSLRMIPGEEARAALEVALNDSSSGVRMAAVEALAYRPHGENWEAALTRCAKQDPESNVRASCLRVKQAHTVQTPLSTENPKEESSS